MVFEPAPHGLALYVLHAAYERVRVAKVETSSAFAIAFFPITSASLSAANNRSYAARRSGTSVRVVGINPGPVATERMEMLLRARAERDFGDATRWREYHAAMPFGRPAAPEEIANAVAFLASPRSAYTTGTILTVDGAPN